MPAAKPAPPKKRKSTIDCKQKQWGQLSANNLKPAAAILHFIHIQDSSKKMCKKFKYEHEDITFLRKQIESRILRLKIGGTQGTRVLENKRHRKGKKLTPRKKKICKRINGEII